ncbi:MAG TPA: ATP-binding protein [Conexibacter sp.]|nr:ATP-binding protein [Conexibacter sp.]
MSRHRSTDLFPTDRPLAAAQMIGRDADVNEIATALAGGASVVLAGPRRTGKTSVCDAVLERLRDEHGTYTVAVDLFRIATAGELAESLVAATLANRSTLRRVLHQTRRAGRHVADALQTAAILRSRGQLGEELEIAFRPGVAARDPERFLDYALELPARIAQADGAPVVVFFDEFQEIANPRHPYGDPDRLTKRMRAIFQRSAGVSFLFAGSVEHMMRDLFTPTHRALHQFGGFHTLRPIDVEQWTDGLSERFARDDCSVGPDALRLAIGYGREHPRTTMLIAQKTHLTTIELETRHVDQTVVMQGLAAALDADRISHEQTIERIRRLHKLGLVVAERVARRQPVYRDLPRGAVRRALEALRDAAVIESRGRGDWRFTNPLLERHLAQLQPWD